jgi:hypothetical protein
MLPHLRSDGEAEDGSVGNPPLVLDRLIRSHRFEVSAAFRPHRRSACPELFARCGPGGRGEVVNLVRTVMEGISKLAARRWGDWAVGRLAVRSRGPSLRYDLISSAGVNTKGCSRLG